MAATVGKGAFVLSLDGTKVDSGIKETKQKLLGFSVGLGAGINVFGTGTTGALLAAGKAVLSKFESLDSANEQLLNLSTTFGLTTEALGGLGYVGKQVGTDMETLAKSLKGIASLSTNRDKLADIGLRPDDLQGDSLQRFGQVADAINNIKDPLARASAGVEIFGKQFLGLDPVLQLGSKGIAQLSERAKELGLLISKEDAEKIDAANDAITDVKLSFEALMRDALVLAAPEILSCAEALIEFVKIVKNTKEALGFGNNGFIAKNVQSATTNASSIGEFLHLLPKGTTKNLMEDYANEEKRKQQANDFRKSIKTANTDELKDANKRADTFKDWVKAMTENIAGLGQSPMELDRIKIGFDQLDKKSQQLAESLIQTKFATEVAVNSQKEFDKAVEDLSLGINQAGRSADEIEKLKLGLRNLSPEADKLVDVLIHVKNSMTDAADLIERSQADIIKSQLEGLDQLRKNGNITADQQALGLSKLAKGITDTFMEKQKANLLPTNNLTDDFNLILQRRQNPEMNKNDVLKSALEEMNQTQKELLSEARRNANATEKILGEALIVKRVN